MDTASYPPPNRPSRRNGRRNRRRANLHTAAAEAFVRMPAVSVSSAARPKLVATGLIVAFLIALLEFFYSDSFYVFDFRPIGLQYLNKAEVEEASGISGYSVFFIDPRAVERALSELPEIKSVSVSAGFPSYIVMKVEERKPAFTYLRGKDAYWVDGDGVAFKARANRADLPVLRDMDSPKPGQGVQPDGVAAFRAMEDAWPDAPRNAEWTAARGLTFQDGHGWRVYLGNADEMAGKVAKLRVLVSQLVAQNAKVKYIDLSKGDPYYQ